MKSTRAITTLFSFLALIPVAICTFSVSNIDPPWNDLRVTYTSSPAMKAFAPLPMTKTDAIANGFTQLGNADAPCSTTNFNGYRFILKDDTAVIVLFDKNGYVAGIQTSFPEDMIDEGILYWFKKNTMFTAEELSLSDGTSGKYYTLTTYFVDPSTICETGRTANEFKSSPSGTNLYYKNGTEFHLIPKNIGDVDQKIWTIGYCAANMGDHFWYSQPLDMDCNDLQNIFILYNHDKLIGFGFITYGNFASPRYEHATPDKLGGTIKTVPTCLPDFVEKYKLSTMHTYLNFDMQGLVCK